MEVKHILEKVRQQKEEEKEYFFALQINGDFVKSTIWAVDQGRVRVFSVGEAHDWQDERGLIEAVDRSLSSATEKFSPQEEAAEPNKVIFGLPSEWVKGEKIAGDRVGLLKEISQKLELAPVGFVVTLEAIVHHLKDAEGIPPTIVLVSLDKKKLVVTLVNLGKIVGSEVVKRSGQLGADLAEGLLRFENEEQFPSRILLYGREGALGVDFEEARQELISYSWQKEGVNFLHLPKVEILPADFDIKAVALAGGHEVAKAEGIDVLAVTSELEPIETGEKAAVVEEETFGFVKGGDVRQGEFREKREEVTGEKKRRRLFLSKLPQVRLPRLKLPRVNFPGIKAVRANFSFQKRLPLITILVGIFILFLGGILGAFYWYLPRAEILLLIEPKRAENEFELRLDPSLGLADQEKLALPAEELEIVIEEEKERETTGIKTVGEPAKGEVMIYNRTASEKTFPAGAEVIGPDSLKFTLDEGITVASESSGPDYTKIPGKATARVTAVEIGTEGNLASGAEFSLNKFAKSDFVAKNESAFSGGTSREIQVVSKDDQAKLIDELRKELEGRAVGKLLAEVPSGKKLLEESLSTEILEKSFDKAADEEANKVKLKLKVKAMVLSYSEEELRSLIEGEVEKVVPAGFEYQRTESEINFELKKLNKDRSATFMAHFRANLVPKLNLEEIKTNLAGKYLYIGKTYLENLPHVRAVEIKITPRLPEKLVTFPRMIKRIKIETRID